MSITSPRHACSLLLLILSSIFGAAVQADNRQKVTVGVQNFSHYLPYSSYNPKGELGQRYQGFNRELLDAFAEIAKLDIEYKAMSIADLYQAFSNDEIDLRYPDNPEWQLYPKPANSVYSSPVIAFIDGALVKPENQGHGLNQLTDFATVNGYIPPLSYSDRENAGNLKITTYKQIEQLLDRIIHGHHQAGYINITVAEHNLRTSFKQPTALLFNPSLPYKRSFRYLSSHTRPNLITAFNQFLISHKALVEQLKQRHKLIELPTKPLPISLHLTTHNLAPYGSYTKGVEPLTDLDFNGSAVDVVRCSLNQLGIKLNLTVTPWRRAQVMVVNNSADGFFAASQNSERDDYAVMSDIIAEQKWQWFYLPGTELRPDSKNFKKNARIGAFVGSNMLTWLEKEGYKVHARPQNTEQLLKMLMAKRLDAFLANDQVVEDLLKNMQPTPQISRTTQIDKPLGVYFRKNLTNSFPKFLPAFNNAVNECKNTAKLH